MDFSLKNNFALILYFIAINSFGILLVFIASIDDLVNYYQKPFNLTEEFDYIIVGSGSAGSIIARRLSQNPKTTILVLEAGRNAISLMDIPSVGVMLQKSDYDWKYETVPQKGACMGLENNKSVWPMGKITGGTGMLNNMVYVRGHPQDFDEWYKDLSGYSYERDILPYFEKMETETDKLVQLSEVNYFSVLSQTILDSARALGFRIFRGFNAELGFTVPTATMHQAKRWTRTNQLKNTPNIVLRSHSTVTKLLLEANYEITGVKYKHFQNIYKVKARKGVVLSAGVIGSPKLLMLSGIGPEEHLTSLKIPVKIKLESVGSNLQDHITTGIDLVLLESKLNYGITEMMSPLAAFEYFYNSSGPWTTIGCENLAFIKTNSNQKRPDLQLMVLPVGVASDNGIFLKKLSGISRKSWTQYFSRINSIGVSFLPIVLHPKSRGTVRLQNSDFESQPLIDPKYLSNRYDLDIIIKGIKLIKRLINSKPMQKLGAKLNRNHFPGCESFEFDSDLYWECYVRHLTITSYHPVGTCRMGSVVDFEFRVKETNKLYIADGSVLPSLTSGNINAAVMMMAEKAADLIKLHDYLGWGVCGIFEIFVPKIAC